MDSDEICEDSAAKNTTADSANLPKSGNIFGILLKKFSLRVHMRWFDANRENRRKPLEILYRQVPK